MSRNGLWKNQEFKDWLTAQGKDWRAVLCFASDHYLRKISLEFYLTQDKRLLAEVIV